MKEALRKAGVPSMPGWSHDTNFHPEVKITLGDCNEPFLREAVNQLDMVCFGTSESCFRARY